MQLSDDADAGAALPIDRYQGLNADLKISADPEDARINRAGRHCAGRKSVRNRRLQ